MVLTKVYQSVQRILKDDPEILDFFENTFRERVASLDILELVSGKISSSHLHHAFSTSLETTASFASARDKASTAILLWNPLLATSLASNLEQVNLLNAAKTRQENTVRKNSKAKPTLSHKPSTTAKPNTHVIYEQLDDYLAKHPAPYANSIIRCDFVGCKFCLGMFQGIALTKCSGHKPCIQLGWFPHVGKPLWNALRKKHDRNVDFVNTKMRSVKEDEIPNRACVCEKPLTPAPYSPRSPTGNWADDVSSNGDYVPTTPVRSPESSEPLEMDADKEELPQVSKTNPLAQFRIREEDMDRIYPGTTYKRVKF